ncbi:MAG: hypothetical protein K8I27_02515 [Planctomycetes bacterium]|nr:hypothetical protein [Planctomycetota bacterium]
MSIAITTIRTPAGVFFTGEVTIGQEKLVIGGGSASGVSGIACPWRRSNGTWLCCCSI